MNCEHETAATDTQEIKKEPKEETEVFTKSGEYFVYLLESTRGGTYVGASVNPFHRLRQHNKEISGGAHATGARVANGETWKLACYVCHFPAWQTALQFEWRWKQLSRKQKHKSAMDRRMAALRELLSLEKPTTKAIPYSEWPMAPEVIQVL